MERKVYRCLNCNSIPHIEIFDDYFKFTCLNNHTEIVHFEKIDIFATKIFFINNVELDICTIHNKKYKLYCKNHEKNICDDCNEEEHKDCNIKFNFENLESIDMKIITELIEYIKKKNSYFSDFIEKIIDTYSKNKMNYILYSNSLKIMKNAYIFRDYFDKGITIKYLNTNLFMKDFSRYNSINELKYEIAEKFKNKYQLENLRYNFIFFFFKNDDLGTIYLNYPEEYEKIKNSKDGELQMFLTKEYEKIKNNKIKLDFSTDSILKELVDYGEQTKTEIIFDKINNKEKLVDENKMIEENYLYQNIDDIGLRHTTEKEQLSVLSLLSKIISDKGIETAIYKDENPSLNDSVIQMLCNDVSQKYDFIFDFGQEENKKILEGKKEYENLSAILKKDLAEKLNLNENDIILSIPKKGSAKISVAFKTPGVYDEKDLESKFKNVKGLQRIHRSVLMEGCKLTKNIFDQCGNNKDPGWGKDEKRGGLDYIPPLGWIGYGLKVKNKYDDGNNDWLSYQHPKNEYAIAYYPIKNYYADPEEIKNLVGSLSSGNTMIDNLDSFHDIFENEINIRSQNHEKCGKGIYLYQDIKVAENQASIIDVQGVRYKILLMCRVNPNKIRIPENFNKVWILNPNSFEIRQYRILIKIVVMTPLAAKTLITYPKPINFYRDIVVKKDLSFFESDILKKVMKSKNFNKHEAVIHIYTGSEYKIFNESLMYGKYYHDIKYTKNIINSYIWCLHSTLRNYYNDVNSNYLIPVKDGTVVYRKTITFDKKKYGIGSQFYFSTFVSASLNENLKWRGNCKMNITIKNNEKNNYCFSVKGVSDYAKEDEVLITCYSNFLIKNMEKNKNGILIVDMECVGYVLDDGNAEKWECDNTQNNSCILL